MKPLVLDCSITMAWCFEDEASEIADMVLEHLGETEVWVPSLWAFEVSNVLLVAERRDRLTSADSKRFVTLLSDLPILIDAGTHERALGAVLSTGREFGLSAYDGAYLELAMRLGAVMATADDKLQAGCHKAGVLVFGTS
jgi:predicted nucleic acid-binding protein